jgi:hypothetical protein
VCLCVWFSTMLSIWSCMLEARVQILKTLLYRKGTVRYCSSTQLAVTQKLRFTVSVICYATDY